MSEHESRVGALAEAVADGRPVDWDEAERSASSAERQVVHQLNVLAALADAHRNDPPTTTQAQPISRWGRFESLVPIGSGALGTVYQCWDPLLERAVALKLLHSSSSGDRALIEARHLAKVRHPNVVTVYGVDQFDGRVGLWMELLSGRSLKEEVTLRGPFSAREAASIGADLCRGLAAVHNAGLVHGDVKAQNVIRDPDGRVVLTDFGAGVYHDTTAGATPMLAGTPFYMAPELFEGRSGSVRSDVYSVGVLLFYLVTGEFPVGGASYEELETAHQTGLGRALRAARSDIPAALARVVDRALAPNPDGRFGSARELEAALRVAIPPADTGSKSRASRAMTVAISIVATAGVMAWLWVRPPVASTGNAVRSIAVLPFTNLSGNPGDEYVADGMTEILTSDLAQLNALKVTSRTSAMRFKNTQQGSPEIGKALHVDALVEGSIARVNGNVRVTAQVIRANADEHVWSETFERRETDLFGLQAEVAAAIATAIKVAVGATPNQRSSRTRPVNPDAQDAYLRGGYLIKQPGAANLLLARDYLKRAVALDPSYARAFALLARCYTYLGSLREITPAESSRLAYEAVTRAIALDEELSEGHSLLADILLYDEWDWTGAEREYRRAIQLNGSNTLALSRYSRLLSAVGHHDDAIENARLAADMDPLSTEGLDSRPLALFYAGRFHEAADGFRQTIRLFPESPGSHFGLGRALAAAGDFTGAEQEIREAIRLVDTFAGYQVELARTLILSGRSREGLDLIRGLQNEDRPVTSLDLGYIQAALGRRDEAFMYLNRAIDERTPSLLWAKVDPRLDPLRDDARFLTLVRNLGVPDRF